MKATFQLFTYDLWSDGEGGFVVNDLYPQGYVTLTLRKQVLNPGTPHESVTYDATNRQINRAIGARGLTWEGDIDFTLYAHDRRGNPACELRRVK